MAANLARKTEKKAPVLYLIKPDRKLRADGEEKLTHTNKEPGKSSEVYAFKDKSEIAAMLDAYTYRIICIEQSDAREYEKRRTAYRNRLLFQLGINLGLRASDLRLLQWSFFFDQLKDNYEFSDFRKNYMLQPKKQKKTGKFIKLFFNDAVKKAVLDYIAEYPISNLEAYVFTKSDGTPISAAQMWNIVKDTAKEVGIVQNIGTHSLRKTWGYWCWHNAEDKAKALVILQRCFQHSDTLTTQRYIGLLDGEIAEMYYSVNLGAEEDS